MSEENLTNSGQDMEPEEQYEELSKSEAMAGVFTDPGDTYETITNTPVKNYWLTPLIIAIILALAGAFMFMQDAELSNKTMKKAKEKMSEQFDKNVKEGKMTKEDADKALDSMDPKGPMFKIFGYGGAVFGSIMLLFIPFLIYLIILKIMKAEFEITNLLNVIGLALLIVALGNIIGLVISILKGDLSSIGLGLVLSEETVGAKMYALISKLDLFSLWFYIVIGIGISRIARFDLTKSLMVAFIPFVLYVILSVVMA